MEKKIADYFIQSGVSSSVTSGDNSDVITLSNSTKSDVKLHSFILKYDDTVSGLRNQKFIIKDDSKQNVLGIGSMVIGAEMIPFSSPYERKVIVPARIIVPKSGSLILSIEKATINIPANSIFWRMEFIKEN